jgi:hypothetical protein
MKTLFLSLIAMAAFCTPIAFAQIGLGSSGAAATAEDIAKQHGQSAWWPPASPLRPVEQRPPSDLLDIQQEQPMHVATEKAEALLDLPKTDEEAKEFITFAANGAGINEQAQAWIKTLSEPITPTRISFSIDNKSYRGSLTPRIKLIIFYKKK